APDVEVVVDGYNVAKLGWPALDLAAQREQCILAGEELARRYGCRVLVVFDGQTVAGAAASGRRLVRIVYSPAGVIADDVIRDEVAALPSSRPVVVATNDAELAESVRRYGANRITSQQLLAVACR
ncbi:MAG: NYN domain-containing protein, partial [Ilumatobacteraceae bacterium]